MARSQMLEREERRELPLAAAGAVLRAATPPADATTAATESFIGHAAVFSQRTAIGNPLTWGFYEEIAPGAFTKTLSEGDARMLIDHDSYYVVARSSAGTLRLSQDKQGLAVDADLDDALSYVADLKANLRNGNVTGMSFGFRVVKDEWSTEEVSTSDGNSAEVEVRTVQEVKLIEVSAVTFPAYEQTDAGLRSAVEQVLRHRGDPDAIRRRASYFPQLAAELGDQVRADAEGEPGESTRAEDVPSDDEQSSEPGESTRNAPSQDAIRRAKARLHAARMSRTA